MTIKKLSYPKPLPNRMAQHPPMTAGFASGASTGWMVIFIVALAFFAMLALALGSGGKA